MADKKVWTAKDVLYIQSLRQDVISLNTKIGTPEDPDTELGDLIADTAPSPEELAVRDDRNRQIRVLIKQALTPREEKVICMRYGFDNGKFMTLEEVGQYFGVTRERIRQIEAKALKKLRFKFTKNNIKLEDI